MIGAFGLPLAWAGVALLRCSGRRLGVALVYHRVAPSSGAPEAERVPGHDVALFERQLAHLRGGYTLVHAADLQAAASCRRRGGRFPVALTFDDDLSTHVAYAAPGLRKVHAPATFFICGGHLDAPFRYWWEDEGEPAMTADDVRSLVADGFAIGFHTLRHEVLTQLDDESLSSAMTDGRDRIAALCGGSLVAISYPYGVADDRVSAAARAAAYALGFTGRPAVVSGGCDPLQLGRVEPSLRSNGHFALRLVTTILRGSPV
jgi:peptidoglycan/xylan/chitin deacetylase (PgdA/CDA1 family)